MPESSNTSPSLTLGASRIVEAANRKKNDSHCDYLGLHHWLLTLIERHPAMIEALSAGFNVQQVRKKLLEDLQQGQPGAPTEDTAVIEAALRMARKNGKEQASERELAAVILTTASYTVSGPNGSKATAASQTNIPAEIAAIPPIPIISIPVKDGAGKPKSSTPVLDQFGRDLIEEARKGKLTRVIGREEEVQLTIETLCRRTKRNPVLVGPAGVGKTAIAEGLAYRILECSVPAMLANARIISVHPSSLTAGASVQGELEKRVKAMLQEASQGGIILFIDEIHTIMGAGGIPGATDIASILKPALARGDIACIAATTDDEYRRFIEHDSALERRFQPIRIHEISAEVTLKILAEIAVELSGRHTIEVQEGVLPFLIDFGQQFMRNRHFPDKGVDLLEQCFAHSIMKGKAVLDLEDAHEVAQRMVGMPLALETRLGDLRTVLLNQAFMSGESITQLIDRLQVTLRGLDLRTTRPNAIVLLSGDAAAGSDRLAGAIAATLYGSSERVISIDFSRMWHAEDINLLVGSPPGYVGYSDSLPLHRLAQTPWSVLRFENIDACHSSIRDVLAQGFYDGFIMDGRGRPIYLSDTVVLLTADIDVQGQHSTGFLGTREDTAVTKAQKMLVDSLGEDMAERIDLFVYKLGGENDLSEKWLEDHLIADLNRRYAKQGVDVKWDESALKWLFNQYKCNWTGRDWENWVDNELSPKIIQYLPTGGGNKKKSVSVQVSEGLVLVIGLAPEAL